MAASLCILLLAAVAYCNAQSSLPSDCANALPCVAKGIADVGAFHANISTEINKCLVPNGCTNQNTNSTATSHDLCIQQRDLTLATCVANGTGNVLNFPSFDLRKDLKAPKIKCASKTSTKAAKQCLKSLVKTGKGILKTFKQCVKAAKPKQCKKIVCKLYKTCKKTANAVCKPGKGKGNAYYAGKLYGFC